MSAKTVAGWLMGYMVMLGGCAHEQKVSAIYPRWGEEFILESAENRATPLKLRLLDPDAPPEPRACLLLVHGMNEYIGRYREIAETFSVSYRVAGFDLFAHGLSNPVIAAADIALAQGASEADVSQAFLAQADLRDLTLLRHDFGLALRFLLDRCETRPVLIVSHSLGSLIAASYLLENQADEALNKRIGGIVLLGPAFSVPDIPGWRGWLQNPAIKLSFAAESNFLYSDDEPWWTSVPAQALAVPSTLLLRGLFEVLSWPGIRNLVTPDTPDWVPDYLSDWQEERDRHRADGYIIRRTLLRFAKAVEQEIIRFRRRMRDFRVPYLLVYSGHDPITAAWGNEDFLRATRANHPANESLCLSDQNFHEHLFSSPRFRKKILRRIDDWLERRLAAL
ncbi:MAG: lysophospholipase [Methylococcaceae bacterium]|nr:lysophospholipase [Methylococcaceae bacterium]MCI0732526.1 lysophospholipase [Methylococcaceae bacterium]